VSFGLVIALSVGGVGCKKGANNSAVGTGGGGDWGKLDKTSLDKASVQPGESAKLTVHINRNEGKKDTVTIKVTPAEGLKVDKASQELKDADSTATFTVTANADAAAKDHEITVTSEPGSGKQTVTLKVQKKG